jgi:hypothetical protein
MAITNDDEQGKSQSFGPYTEDEVRIPEPILGSRQKEISK